MEKLPTEVALLISNHLSFKTYIQYSQTCRALYQSLNSSSVIQYLHNRFNLGHKNQTGVLLLFTLYNILEIPEKIREIVLEHFIAAYQKDTSFIRGWSIIHAIMNANPGLFLELLRIDNSENKKPAVPMPLVDEKKKNFLFHQQRSFAKNIFNGIIASSIPHRHKLRSSKTYQSIFTKLLYTGDLSTIELCLRIVGPPRDSITLSETDYNENFPIIDHSGNINTKRKRESSDEEYYDNANPIDIICRDDEYLKFTPAQMRLLAKQLLQKYQAKIIFYPSTYNNNPTRPRHGNRPIRHKRRRFL